MSKYYDKVLKYYSLGIWTKSRVRAAVEKEWITTSEYRSIVGENY